MREMRLQSSSHTNLLNIEDTPRTPPLRLWHNAHGALAMHNTARRILLRMCDARLFPPLYATAGVSIATCQHTLDKAPVVPHCAQKVVPYLPKSVIPSPFKCSKCLTLFVCAVSHYRSQSLAFTRTSHSQLSFSSPWCMRCSRSLCDDVA